MHKYMAFECPARRHVYIASDVDARDAQATAVIKAQRERIAELVQALREIVGAHEESDDGSVPLVLVESAKRVL